MIACACPIVCRFPFFFQKKKNLPPPSASKVQTTTIDDPLAPASPLPMRCIHGKWLEDDILLSQASLLQCDHLEVRQKGYDEGAKKKGAARGLVEKLQLLPKLGIDEEDKVQKQFMAHAGLLAEVAVVLRPVNDEGEVWTFFLFFFFFYFFLFSELSLFSKDRLHQPRIRPLGKTFHPHQPLNDSPRPQKKRRTPRSLPHPPRSRHRRNPLCLTKKKFPQKERRTQ